MVFSVGLVTSIDRIWIEKNDVGKDLWVVSWTGLGSGTDKLTGGWTPIRETGGVREAEEEFKITLDSTDNECWFDIKDDTGKRFIDTLDGEQKFFWGWDTSGILDFIADCKKTTPYVIRVGNRIEGKTIVCLNKAERIGTPGIIYNKRLVFKTAVTVQIEGETPSQPVIITTDGSDYGASASIGNNVDIKWTGNMVSGKSCELPIDVKAVYTKTGWKVVDKGVYESGFYRAWDIIITCMNDWKDDFNGGDNTESWRDCYKNYNIAANNAIKSDTYDPFVKQGDMSITSGKIKFEMEKLLQYPTFLLYIDSDWLKIKKTIGIPEIISASSQKFDEGGIGNINIQVKSKEAEGSYEIKAICNPPFSSEFPIFENIGKDVVKNYQIKIYGSEQTSTNPIISGTCTISMRETEENTIVTKDVSVSFNQKQTCDPNTKWCDGKNIVQCSSSGLEESISETCAQSCIIVVGEASCVVDECQVNTDCDDSKDLTLDKCISPLIGARYCENTVIGTCVSDVDCNDNNKLTVDNCIRPIVGSNYCENKAIGTCQDDGDCDDNNLYTKDVCTRPIFGSTFCENKWTCTPEGQAKGWLDPTCCEGLKEKDGICVEEQPLDFEAFIPYMVLAGIGGLLGFLLTKKKKAKTLFAILGAGLGLVLAFGLIWVSENLLIVSLFGVGGLALMFIAGPAILGIVMLLLRR